MTYVVRNGKMETKNPMRWYAAYKASGGTFWAISDAEMEQMKKKRKKRGQEDTAWGKVKNWLDWEKTKKGM